MFRKIAEFYFLYYGFFKLKPNKFYLEKSNSDIIKGFEFRILNSSDLVYFEKLNLVEYYFTICKNRLNNPNEFLCFALIDLTSCDLAYYSWINQSEMYYIKEVNVKMKLKLNQSVLFEDDNTIEKYRKKGFHKFMMNKRIEYCINNNIHSIFIAIYLKNIPALRTIKSIGFRKINKMSIYYRQGTIGYTLNKFLNYFKR
jgi:hypothetical protein